MSKINIGINYYCYVITYNLNNLNYKRNYS